MDFKTIKLWISVFLSSVLLSCLHRGKKVLDIGKQKALISLEKSKDENLSLSKRIEIVTEGYDKIKKLPTDSLTLALISKKSALLFQANEKDSFSYYDHLLNKRAKQIANDHYLARSHANIGSYFKNMMKYDSAYFHFNRAKNHYKKLKDSSKVGQRLLNMGVIQKNQNDFFGSKETLTEALQFLNAEKDLKYIASTYNALATNHRKLLNFTDAIDYYLKAIERTNSKKDGLIYQNNLAATYIDDQQFDRAVSILQETARDSMLKNNRREYARVLDNLAYAQWSNGEKVAEQDFLNPLNLRKQNNDKRGQLASYTHLGEFYAQNAPARAKRYFDTVVQLSKALKVPRAEKDVLKHLMQLEPENIGLRNRCVFLQDSLYGQELKVKTQFAKYKYDDKLKQESILRLERENAEKELEANRQRTQKIISFGSVFFLISILGFTYSFFRQRNRRLKQENRIARLAAIHETEAELSRRLHDDHGGKLNHTMLLVQNDADKSLILDNLEALYDQSRNFSREINDVDIGPNFREGLFSMLQFRTPSSAKLLSIGDKEIDWSLVAPLSKKAVFKALQELMINMNRHSKASLISISFKKGPKTLKIKYIDDGVGASKEELWSKNGLRNTEKRIQAIGGTITFDSEKGNGFRADLEIPH